jgi:hypothetical protein
MACLSATFFLTSRIAIELMPVSGKIFPASESHIFNFLFIWFLHYINFFLTVGAEEVKGKSGDMCSIEYSGYVKGYVFFMPGSKK